MTEAKFSKQVVKYLEDKGAVVNVNTGSMFERVGRADVEVCYKGHFLALELKVGNYQPDPLQVHYLQDVRNAGGIGLLLRDNIHELMLVVHMIDNGVLQQYEQPELPEIELGGIIYD